MPGSRPGSTFFSSLRAEANGEGSLNQQQPAGREKADPFFSSTRVGVEDKGKVPSCSWG